MVKIVGIGGYAISNQAGDVIKTYALSSCVAVTVHNPLKKIGGMIHIALPHPLPAHHSAVKPTYYAALGVPYLIDQMISRYGCSPDELEICVFGGANSVWKNDNFRIGARNLKAVTTILETMHLPYTLSDVGGFLARSVELEVGSGEIKVIRQPIAV